MKIKDIPVHEFPVCINFTKFMTALCKEKGYDYRDFVGYFKRQPLDDSIPYLDFWHWLIDNTWGHIHNGCVVGLGKEWLEAEETPAWCKQIIQDIFDAVEDHPALDKTMKRADSETIWFYVGW